LPTKPPLQLGDVVVFVAHDGGEHPATVHTVKDKGALDLVVHDGLPGISRDVPHVTDERKAEAWRER